MNERSLIPIGTFAKDVLKTTLTPTKMSPTRIGQTSVGEGSRISGPCHQHLRIVILSRTKFRNTYPTSASKCASPLYSTSQARTTLNIMSHVSLFCHIFSL